MRETAHRIDRLVGQIVIRGSVVLHQLPVFGVETVAQVVDFLVDLCSVVITLLTGTGHGELDARRMPGSNTSNLAKSLVGFAWQLFRVPTGSNAWKSKA